MFTHAMPPPHLQIGVPGLHGVPLGGGGSWSHATLELQQQTGTARVTKSPCPTKASNAPESSLDGVPRVKSRTSPLVAGAANAGEIISALQHAIRAIEIRKVFIIASILIRGQRSCIDQGKKLRMPDAGGPRALGRPGPRIRGQPSSLPSCMRARWHAPVSGTSSPASHSVVPGSGPRLATIDSVAKRSPSGRMPLTPTRSQGRIRAAPPEATRSRSPLSVLGAEELFTYGPPIGSSFAT